MTVISSKQNNSLMLAKDLHCCVIIPTYNNSGTLQSVIDDVSQYIADVIVVNDGTTDAVLSLSASNPAVRIISYQPNRGKGYALKQGFKYALSSGFRYAITLDSDGQHSGSDILFFLNKIQQSPDSLIIGCRSLNQENMPGRNTFANRFSNFWYWLQTGIRLSDTQSGFRLYPLKKISGIHFFTNRYEAELEMLVRAAWRGINVCHVAISVYYPPPGERISHYRPFIDFIRISVLNTFLTIIAFVYAYPSRWICKLLRVG